MSKRGEQDLISISIVFMQQHVRYHCRRAHKYRSVRNKHVVSISNVISMVSRFIKHFNIFLIHLPHHTMAHLTSSTLCAHFNLELTIAVYYHFTLKKKQQQQQQQHYIASVVH